MVTKEDLSELKRIATNTYDGEKRFINNLILKIGSMERELLNLRAKVKKLEEDAVN